MEDKNEHLENSSRFIQSAQGMKVMQDFARYIYTYMSENDSVISGIYRIKTFYHLFTPDSESDQYYVIQFYAEKTRFQNFKENKGLLRWLHISPEFKHIDSSTELTINSEIIYSLTEDKFLSEVKSINADGVKSKDGQLVFQLYLNKTLQDVQRAVPSYYLPKHKIHEKDNNVVFSDYSNDKPPHTPQQPFNF